MCEEWLPLLKKIAEEGHQFKFEWLGFKIAQLGEDLLALQEIISKVRPNIIIETGVFQGGTSMFFASMLHILGINGKVIGIDIKKRQHIQNKIKNHPLGKYVKILTGPSTCDRMVNAVKKLIVNKKVLIHLDSNHSYKHVLEELNRYAPMVSVGSYIIVGDTGLADLTAIAGNCKGYTTKNNPMVAVNEFLKNNSNFVRDEINNKLIMTANPKGFLRRIK